MVPDNPLYSPRSSSLPSHRSVRPYQLPMLMASLRLVMPPALFLALAYPWYKLAHLLFPYYIALAIYSGGIAGYITYDMTHYFLHHHRYPLLILRQNLMSSLPSFYKELKRYHLAHHYKNFELGYGVTSKFWDTVFGTTRYEIQILTAGTELDLEPKIRSVE